MLKHINIEEYQFRTEEDARLQARQDLKRILFSKYGLQNLHQLENEVRQTQENLSRETDLRVREVEEIGNLVEEGKEEVEKIKGNLEDLKVIWKEGTRRLRLYGEKLDELFNAKRNIDTLVSHLESYTNMKEQIQQLREMLADSTQMLYVYKKLKILSHIRFSLLDKLMRQDNKEAIRTVEERFSSVALFEVDFFQSIWNYFQKTLQIARNQPEFLVILLRIIENDEQHNNTMKNRGSIGIRVLRKEFKKSELNLLESVDFAGKLSRISSTEEWDSHSHVPLTTAAASLSLKQRCISAIKQSIHDRFAPVFELQDIESAMAQVENIMEDLLQVKAHVVPCFPPAYQIFKLYTENYLEKLENVIMPFVPDSGEQTLKDPGVLVVMASWLDKCEMILPKLGIEAQSEKLFALQMKVKSLLPYFIQHIEEVLEKKFEKAWSIQQKFERESEDYSAGFANDLFSILNNELDILGSKLKGDTLLELIKASIERVYDAMYMMVTDTKKLIHNTDNYIIVVIRVNNVVACLNYLKKLKPKCQGLLYEHLKLRLDGVFEAQIQKCHNLINEEISYLCETIYTSIEKELIIYLFTKKWVAVIEQNPIVASIFATLNAYFQEFESAILEEIWLRRIIQKCFALFATKYTSRYLLAISQLKKLEKKFHIKPNYESIPFCETDLKKPEISGKLIKKAMDKVDFMDYVRVMNSDLEIIREFVDKYEDCIQSNIPEMIRVLVEVMSVERDLIITQFGKLFEWYEEQGSSMLCAAMTIRTDSKNDRIYITSLLAAFKEKYKLNINKEN